MKYNVICLFTDPPKYGVDWPGFTIHVSSRDGADKLAEELNRLEGELSSEKNSRSAEQGVIRGLRKDLAVQIEAKCKALKRVEELEQQVFKGECENKALEQRLGVRTGQVDKLLAVLERTQGILAAYIEPSSRVKPRDALQDLLDVLDDSALVKTMHNLRKLILVKDNGSVELTEADKLAVLKALDDQAETLRLFTIMQPASYLEACRILGASEDGDVQDETEYLNSGANGERLRETIRQHKGLEVGDEMIVTPTHKQYVSRFGQGVDIVQPFIVQADRVYVNDACILDMVKSIIGQTELASELQERVVNNTVNNFGPDEKLKRKIRKLKHRIEGLVIERDELLMEVKQNSERD